MADRPFILRPSIKAVSCELLRFQLPVVETLIHFCELGISVMIKAVNKDRFSLVFGLANSEEEEDFGNERLKQLQEKLPQVTQWAFLSGPRWTANPAFVEHFILPLDEHTP